MSKPARSVQTTNKTWSSYVTDADISDIKTLALHKINENRSIQRSDYANIWVETVLEFLERKGLLNGKTSN